MKAQLLNTSANRIGEAEVPDSLPVFIQLDDGSGRTFKLVYYSEQKLYAEITTTKVTLEPK